MKVLLSKKRPTEAILIASTEDDSKVLDVLYPITWGFHTKWKLNKENPIIPPKGDMVYAVLQKYPDAVGIGVLTSPEGFVEKQPIKEQNIKGSEDER